MGRRLPNENNITLTDPFLYFSFCMVGFATSITIITALCIVRIRKKSSPPTSMSDNGLDKVENVLNESTIPPTTTLEHEHPSTSEGLEKTAETQNNEMLVKELPLPPALQQHPQVNPTFVKRATSERRLSFNLSRKVPRSLSVARNWDQGGNGGWKKGTLKSDDQPMGMKTKEKLKADDSVWMKTKEKLKRDDSVWMKTIILGGKCVPDEEDDVVIYEDKGKKISAYHPRKSTTVSLSRQSSYLNPANPDALSVHKSSEEIINKTCEEETIKL
ncbi:hypothetical protein PHAVU_001G037300 [Phaseolus vulgaris]|uniref:Uncharacterized protein n=1 Tax=Phaseolus vulgaris TaxID=3885 RepID=V7CSB7_PHAVU|nr:hypothetical protein PHAVU_001G037300g [Phaseolus vulgaris]ESW33029.1 hypothetical protein PHAVU_001G037300g [Phaseolus vulgaris]